MELVAANVESFHLGVADFDAFFVGSSVERTLDAQPGFGCCGGDEFDHGHSGDKRAGAPVLRDVAEKAVLDPVPLRCARRIVADMDGETYLIGKLLKFYPPQPHARTLAARYRTARYLSALRTAAIGGDRQLAGIRITLAAHSLQPLPDRSHGERGGIVRNANADPALVGGDIVNAIGRNLAKVFVLEIVDVHTLRSALGPVIAAAIPEIANQLLLPVPGRD